MPIDSTPRRPKEPKRASPPWRRARPWWRRARSPRPLSVTVTVSASLVLLGALAGPALAGRYVDQAAAGLRRDPVYVDRAARPGLAAASQTALRDRLRRAGTPVYVAVLPQAALREAAGGPDRLAAAVVRALGRGGTVVAVAGGRMGAASNTLPPGRATAAIRASSRAHRGDLAATLLDFAGRAERAAGAEPREASFWRELWERPLVRPVAFVLGALVAVTLIDLLVLRLLRRRRQGRSTGFSEVQALAREDIVALGEDLKNLDVGLDAEGGNRRGVGDHARAYESFQQAVEAFERAGTVHDFAAVSTALESSRYFMTVARARFEGSEPPQRRPPCFFDTRHGPSVDDVGWMPQAGPPRPVPACETCMWNIANGIEPAARRIMAGGRRVPFYEAPAHFESWFAGYFGGAAASLVDGFPLGRALDDGYAGGLNTFGGGYGYLPVSYADTGVLDPGGADIGHRQPGADTELVIRPAGHDAGSGEE